MDVFFKSKLDMINNEDSYIFLDIESLGFSGKLILIFNSHIDT